MTIKAFDPDRAPCNPALTLARSMAYILVVIWNLDIQYRSLKTRLLEISI